MSYENPTTYVDTESSKYLAGAIAGIGQMTAKVIKDDIKRRADEAAENKKRTEKTTQAYKKYQLAGQSNVNLLSKDLNFSQNDNFRKGMSGVVDRLAKAKSAYEFSTDEDETKKLGDEIFKLDTFITKTFGGEMDDLQTDVMKMKEIMTKEGLEGGLDMYQDSNYTALLMQMAQGNEPEGLEFNFDPDTQDITMTVTGDQYKDGSYTMSLKGNQSMEIGEIPKLDFRNPTGKGGKSILQNGNVLDDQNKIPVSDYSSEIGESQDLEGNKTIFKYKINKAAEQKIQKVAEAEARGLLSAGEGLAQGFTGADAFYRNVLLDDVEANGKFDKDGNLEVPPFLESGNHEIKDSQGNVLYSVPVTEESWNVMVERITKREVAYVNSLMPLQEKPTINAPKTKKEGQIKREETEARLNILNKDLIKADFGRGKSQIGGQVDITFDSKFQRTINNLGFSFKKLDVEQGSGDQFVTLKSIATGKTQEIPSKGTTDLELKQYMYILDGGKKDDEGYKNLTAKVDDDFNVFKRKTQ